MFSVYFHPRVDALVHNLDFISRSQVRRIASLALPFACFYKPVSVAVNMGISAGQIFQSGKDVVDSWRKEESGSFQQNAVNFVFIVSSVAMRILMPKVDLALSQAVQGYVEVLQCRSYLQKGDYYESAKTGYSLVSRVAYVSASFYATSELLMISLVMQALTELSQSYEEYQKSRLPEAFVKTALASMRIYEAKGHALTSYRNFFGKKITQEGWDKMVALIEKPHPQEEQKKKSGDEKKEITQSLWKNLKEKWIKESLQVIEDNENEMNKIRSLGISASEEDHKIEQAHLRYKRKMRELRDLGKMLEKGHFSSRITGICIEKAPFIQFSCKNIVFDNCRFKENEFSFSSFVDTVFRRCVFQDNHFDECQLERTKFHQCSAYDTTFFGSRLQDCGFFESIFHNTNFATAVLERVIFQDTDLRFSCFNESTLHRVDWIRSLLSEVNFFKSRPEQATMNKCDLTDCLLAGKEDQIATIGCTAPRITRPVVSLGWQFSSPLRYSQLTRRAMVEQNIIAFRYDNEPSNLDGEVLCQEVQLCTALASEDERSAGQRLLKEAVEGSQLHRVVQTAQEIVRYVDGVFIPGGEDICPIFYKKHSLDALEKVHGNFSRDLLELALVEEAEKADMPLMGVCRGAQIANVYHGAKLYNVPRQWGLFQDLERTLPSKRAVEALFRKIFEKEERIQGFSCHHQSCKTPGKGIEVILKHQDLHKAFMSENGRMLLTQFHPEIYISLLEKEKSLEDLRGQLWEHMSTQNEEESLYLQTYIKVVENPDEVIEMNRKIYLYFFDMVRKKFASKIGG